jgi:hypothetical protein
MSIAADTFHVLPCVSNEWFYGEPFVLESPSVPSHVRFFG